MYTLDTLLLVLTSSFESYFAPALMSAASPRTDVVRFMLLIELVVAFWLHERDLGFCFMR
jgi:hypothetical protein